MQRSCASIIPSWCWYRNTKTWINSFWDTLSAGWFAVTWVWRFAQRHINANFMVGMPNWQIESSSAVQSGKYGDSRKNFSEFYLLLELHVSCNLKTSMLTFIWKPTVHKVKCSIFITIPRFPQSPPRNFHYNKRLVVFPAPPSLNSWQSDHGHHNPGYVTLPIAILLSYLPS